MHDLPRGTVTFLFTDIESSTRLWHEHPGSMPAAYARHDALLREAAADEGGVVFKTVGDAFQIAFPTAIGGVIAALRAQHALTNEDWDIPEPLRVRMALHTGAVDPDADGDYRSPALNRLGRLLAAGHGEQVLVSQATMELARDHMPTGAAFRDLGEQRLKDLYRSERVYQLEGPALKTAFPPLRTLDTRPNNLPTQLTQFIGRQDDVNAVSTLLTRDDVRLVTLTGPGGIGKTRLGLQVAADVLDAFEHGVFFVQLDTLTDPSLVPISIAQALGLRQDADVPNLTTLISYLRDKHLLLVLDNLEQVIDAADGLGEMLVACPAVKVLATSRVRLQIGGEQEYPVQPLALPRKAAYEDVTTVTQYESVRLFVERARLVKPSFEVTPQNVPAIAEICTRLDGMPLAIELAAARIRMLPPEAMLRRLTARLSLLTGGARNLPPRQQTLRGAIAWSHELLIPGDQALFRRLSVFAGGATLDAIDAVAVDPDDAWDAFDGLERLVDQSLVRQLDVDGEPRFTMYETIREFALTELEARGEAEEAHRRHAGFCIDVAAAYRDDLSLGDMAAWLDRMELERDNIRAALTWCLDHDIPAAYRMIGLTSRLWSLRGPSHEGRAWIERVLAKPRGGVAAKDLARVLRVSAPFGKHPEDTEISLQRLTEAFQLFTDLGMLAEASVALSVRATFLSRLKGPDESVLVGKQALELARASGSESPVRLCLNNLGYQHYMFGDMEAASRYFDELGVLLANSDEYNDPFYVNSLADFYRDTGRTEEAETLYQESLQNAWSCKWFPLMSFNVMGQVSIAIAREEWMRAATLAGGELMIRQGRDLGIEFDPDTEVFDSEYERMLTRALDALGPETYREAWSRGASMSMEELVAEAAKSSREAKT